YDNLITIIFRLNDVFSDLVDSFN
ncbi:hypothetical protein D047_0604B, partial [Vibrio parahaemolyticus VPTS-2010_2]